MNKILVVFLLILIVSCRSGNHEIAPKKVVITGRVLNPDPSIFRVQAAVNRISMGQDNISPVLNDDGSFRITFESYAPTDVWIIYNMNFLVLTHPGDSIHLEFDGSKKERPDILETIRYTGDASVLNAEAGVFQKLYYASRTYSDWDRKLHAIKDFNENQYKVFCDSLYNEGYEIYNKFVSEVHPSAEAENWAKAFLDLEHLKTLIVYPLRHNMAINKKNDQGIPISYFDFIKDNFSIDKNCIISGYSLMSFVNTYGIYVLEKIRSENERFFNSPDSVKKHPEILDSLRFCGTVKYINDPLLRQMVLTEMLYQELSRFDVRMFERFERQIKDNVQEKYLIEPLLKLYNQTIQTIQNPKISSDAILKKLTGASVKPGIDSLISKNTGKVIYMDCWATWCGPCISEMQSSKKLMEKYKNKGVAFVFVCLDSEEKAWKSVVAMHSLAGQHLLLNKKQSGDFRSAFNIKGIPHYILFNKKGVIVENGTDAPGFAGEKIDKLLQSD